MELATLAGYEPQAAVTLWEKMGSLGGSTPPPFLSTHPTPGNRQETLAAMVPEMNELNPGRTHPPVHPLEMVQ